MRNKIYTALLPVLLLFLTVNALEAQQHSVARRWNDAMILAIREDLARPPVQARNLFHVSMAMWDAWAAYDTLTADTYLLGKTVGTFTCQFDGVPMPADIEAAREKAISYAAFRVLSRRYLGSPNYLPTITRFRSLMTMHSSMQSPRSLHSMLPPNKHCSNRAVYRQEPTLSSS